jgi:hypothetical protein
LIFLICAPLGMPPPVGAPPVERVPPDPDEGEGALVAGALEAGADVAGPDAGVDIDGAGDVIVDGAEVDIAGAGDDIGIADDDGAGEDCADATPVAASASAAVASISRLDCCMLEAPVNAGCLSGAVLPQWDEIDACSV